MPKANWTARAELPHNSTRARRARQPHQNIAVRIAIEYGILQAVVEKEDRNVSAADLAKEAGADELLTERLMRIICWMGYCDEVGENLYRANAVTKHVCTPGTLGAEKNHTDIVYAVGGEVAKMMRAQHGFYPNPPNGLKDPMEWSFGHKFFDFLAGDDEQRCAFNDYMAARREGYQLQWFDIFPRGDQIAENPVAEPDQVLICDVGGGQGHELVKFKERHPEAQGRLVLEDLASTLAGLGLPWGIETIAHDFFRPQPVNSARFYYMRQIAHDWPDEECRTILVHIVRAMNSESRLLIDDYVMPSTNAEFREIHMDMSLMLLFRSEERTERRWRGLLESAGLELVRIWTPQTGFESVIEARIQET